MNRVMFTRRELVGGATVGFGAAALGMPARADAILHERKMHLGLVTYNVAKDWTLEQILANCKAVGIEGVELRTTHKHGVEPSLSADQRTEVRKKCADAGLLQVSLGSVCEFQSPDPSVVRKNVDICREFILLGKDIGARGVKVRPNGFPKDLPEEKILEQIGRALNECGKIGADNGVEIWMEVHGGGTQNPPNARKIMDFCGHPNVGLTWNSNPTDVSNGSVKPAFDLLGKFVRCCHINDLWGNYPYRGFFSLLNSAGYDRFTLCEVSASIQPEDGTTFLKCYKGLWNELSR